MWRIPSMLQNLYTFTFKQPNSSKSLDIVRASQGLQNRAKILSAEDEEILS